MGRRRGEGRATPAGNDWPTGLPRLLRRFAEPALGHPLLPARGPPWLPASRTPDFPSEGILQGAQHPLGFDKALTGHQPKLQLQMMLTLVKHGSSDILSWLSIKSIVSFEAIRAGSGGVQEAWEFYSSVLA